VALLVTGALELPAGAAQAARERRSVRVPFAREVVGRRRGPAAGGAAASEPPDRSQARLEAEQSFRRAQQLLAAEKLHEAVKLLRRALELEPAEPEYAMYEAWASYLEARHALRVGRARALAAARRQLEAEPKAAKPHSILGRLALDEGERERATREFELALLREPEDEEAKRGLKLLRG
jgi:Flp pilus assembly protein TadD